jgi:hypothetical protein
MQFDFHPWSALSAMFVSGTIGGLASKFISERQIQTNSSELNFDGPKSYLDATITGIAASMLVPLFLVLASPGAPNSLLTGVFDVNKGPNFHSSLVIICSYCVIFGMFLRRLAAKISGLLEKKIEKLEQIAQNNKDNIADLENNTAQAISNVGQSQKKESLTDEVRKDRVLRSMQDSGERHWRASWSIASEAGLSADEVEAVLNDLIAAGSVETITRATGKPGFRTTKSAQ